MSRKSRSCFLAITLLLAEATAFATGWKPVFQDGTIVGTVTPASGAPALSYVYSMTQTPTAYLPIYNALYEIYGTLRRDWDATVYRQLSGLSQYRSHASSVKGPIRLTYETWPASSSSRVNITAPSLGFTAQFHDNYWGIGVSCSVSMSSGIINVTATNYVSSTGVLVQPQIAFSPTKSVDCSTSLSWIPVLGGVLDNLASGKVSSALAAAQTTLLTQLQTKLAVPLFFGLPSIPRGKYLYNGVDYGAYLADNLSYLLSSGGFEVFLSDPYMTTSPSGSTSPGRHDSVITDRFSVKFSGVNAGLAFHLYEQANYTRVWVCDPGVRCQQP